MCFSAFQQRVWRSGAQSPWQTHLWTGLCRRLQHGRLVGRGGGRGGLSGEAVLEGQNRQEDRGKTKTRQQVCETKTRGKKQQDEREDTTEEEASSCLTIGGKGLYWSVGSMLEWVTCVTEGSLNTTRVSQ